MSGRTWATRPRRLPSRTAPASPPPVTAPAGATSPPPSPRRLPSWTTPDPAKPPATRQTRLEHALKHCPELQATAGYVRSFAALLTADHDGDLHEHTTRLDAWIEQVRAD